MDYLEFVFEVSPREPWSDLLADELGEIGFETFEDLPTGLKAFVPQPTFVEQQLQDLPLLKEEQVRISWKSQLIPAQNWNETWEQNFQPITVADRCIVRATFHEISSPYEYEIVIDPRMAFGTGHHATTALVMEALLDMELKNNRILDMGCGTGVLAILAAKKGATDILAIDNDEWAVNNARENAETTATPWIDVQSGDSQVLDKEGFNLILANINKNVLLRDLKRYATALMSGGTLLISGFYEHDREDLCTEAALHGLTYQHHLVKDTWAMIRLSKEA